MWFCLCAWLILLVGNSVSLSEAEVEPCSKWNVPPDEQKIILGLNASNYCSQLLQHLTMANLNVKHKAFAFPSDEFIGSELHNNSRCYILVTEPMDFHEASSVCQSATMRLMSIAKDLQHKPNELDSLVNFVKVLDPALATKQYWSGMHRNSSNGKYKRFCPDTKSSMPASSTSECKDAKSNSVAISTSLSGANCRGENYQANLPFLCISTDMTCDLQTQTEYEGECKKVESSCEGYCQKKDGDFHLLLTKGARTWTQASEICAGRSGRLIWYESMENMQWWHTFVSSKLTDVTDPKHYAIGLRNDNDGTWNIWPCSSIYAITQSKYSLPFDIDSIPQDSNTLPFAVALVSTIELRIKWVGSDQNITNLAFLCQVKGHKPTEDTSNVTKRLERRGHGKVDEEHRKIAFGTVIGIIAGIGICGILGGVYFSMFAPNPTANIEDSPISKVAFVQEHQVHEDSVSCGTNSVGPKQQIEPEPVQMQKQENDEEQEESSSEKEEDEESSSEKEEDESSSQDKQQ